MKANVLLSPVGLDELYFTGKTTIIIDILRASSTIVTALQNGAKEIVPVASVEFAVKVSGGMFGGQTLLGGERNTKKIEGFALGNSPLEYSPEVVTGKSIIFYTTNGSKAIVKAKFSQHLFICSFMNLGAVAEKLVQMKTDFEILCSGRNNLYSMEDTVCAGKLISEIAKLDESLLLTDSAKASVALSKSFGKNILKMMKEAEHGKILVENGFEEDLKYCSKLNTTSAIPFYSGNVLKLLSNDKNSSR
ncbi:MAG: 2-phosphosulfolactate phosphatase [Ignavibacteriales bacterium]|nr:MAG: 2-phosphosulfolactate phosphatase [Ignavibacteriales bacterium]